jgi:aminopeptidase N
LAIKEIINFETKSNINSVKTYMMSNKTKIPVVVLGLLTAFVLIGYILYKNIGRIFPNSPIANYITLSEQFKDFNEKELIKYNPQTQRSIDVIHYNIKLDLRPDEKKIYGDVTISMKLNNEKPGKIEINFYDNLDISLLEVNGQKAKYSRNEKIISIEKPKDITDSADVRIIYSGTPKSMGFGSFVFSSEDNKPFIYSLSEPVFASTWYPCIDLPDDKAQVDIFITNDSSAVSVSNGKLVEVKTAGDRRTYHWKTVYPISTYLIALYSGSYKTYSQKYISITHDTLQLVYYAFPKDFEEAKADFADHGNYIKVFEQIFGPYPFIKEKYGVAEFLWDLGAMENQTITGIGAKFISGRKLFSDMLIHELAHHWWGDAVGPKTWKDIWLNEGFATYSEALYWEKQAGFSALQSTLSSKTGTFSHGTLYDPGNELFSRLVYDKGAWVLHMLRKEVGDKTFFSILKEYFKRFKYSNASTNDFKKVCENLSGKNLSVFFNQWVYKGEGIIELEYSWTTDISEKGYMTKIKIKQLQNGYDIYKFPLDIKMIFDKDDDFTVSSSYVSSKDSLITLSSVKKPAKIILDPDKWLLSKIILKNYN